MFVPFPSAISSDTKWYITRLSLAMAVLLFITFFCFRHSLPNGQHTIPIQNSNRDGYDGSAYVNDDFLRGANLQKPALASPPTYVVSEEILSGPNRKLSPEEQKQKDDSYKKSQAEKKNKEDQQRRLKNEVCLTFYFPTHTRNGTNCWAVLAPPFD